MVYKTGIREIEMGSITWRQILNNNFSLINSFLEIDTSNALTNNSVEKTSIGINTKTNVNTLNTLIIGDSTSQGNNNIGIGYNNQVANNSVVMGYNNNVTDNSVVVGNTNTIKNDNIVLGNSNNIQAENNIIVGNNISVSNTNFKNIIAFSTQTKTIINPNNLFISAANTNNQDLVNKVFFQKNILLPSNVLQKIFIDPINNINCALESGTYTLVINADIIIKNSTNNEIRIEKANLFLTNKTINNTVYSTFYSDTSLNGTNIVINFTTDTNNLNLFVNNKNKKVEVQAILSFSYYY